MLDFPEFLKICQNQLNSLLLVRSIEDLANFNQKIQDFSYSINHLFPREWQQWKEENEITPFIPEFKAKANLLLKVIDFYEILPESNQICIIIEKDKKLFPLLDPMAFITANLYNKYSIYFYILLGEILRPDNFDYFQLYGIYLKMTFLERPASCSDTEPTET